MKKINSEKINEKNLENKKNKRFFFFFFFYKISSGISTLYFFFFFWITFFFFFSFFFFFYIFLFIFLFFIDLLLKSTYQFLIPAQRWRAADSPQLKSEFYFRFCFGSLDHLAITGLDHVWVKGYPLYLIFFLKHATDRVSFYTHFYHFTIADVHQERPVGNLSYAR